jgi:hypothetical protein
LAVPRYAALYHVGSIVWIFARPPIVFIHAAAPKLHCCKRRNATCIGLKGAAPAFGPPTLDAWVRDESD